LDGTRVLAIVDRLPPGEARAIRLRFGFEGAPLSYEELSKKLLRFDGKQGVVRETARLEVKRAIHHLRRPSWRKDWDEARK
jgi:DNA-directed RNA polymerase sigma subunit (sigma70/sigma32)